MKYSCFLSFISRSQLDSGFDKGGSFAAYYKGELVVNIWGGYVNEDTGQKWEEDTMPCFHSATKSFSSIVISHLVERYNYNCRTIIFGFVYTNR